MNLRCVLTALVALLLLPAAALAKPREVEVQLLGLNDFHGHLESTTPGTIAPTPSEPRVPAGGAEYLATHIRNLEGDERNSLVVSAGDLIGASPLLSALFHDEPTIEAMNRIGLDLNAVGNHEFDEGAAELKRMQRGGCHPVDGCQDGTGFGGAKFDFLAANVVKERSGRTLFRPYEIRRFGRREGRLHRHDARGHAGHRVALRRGRARLPRRGRDGQPLRARASQARRAGDRGAAPRGRHAVPAGRHQRLQRDLRPRRGHRRAHDQGGRPVRHGAHPLGLQLRDRRSPGHERQLLRAPRDGHRPHARPALARRGRGVGQQHDRDPERVQGGRHHRADRPLQHDRRAAARPRDRADLGRHHAHPGRLG